MSDEPEPRTIDIRDWVERARNDPPKHLERKATEILLVAIGGTSPQGEKLYLKGGILMGVAYGSPRQTADIDLTAELEPTHAELGALRAGLDRGLRRTPPLIGYPDMICRIQSIELQPRTDLFEDADFPAIKMKVAYAVRDTRPHKALDNGQCPTTLEVDISYREPVRAVEFVRLDSADGTRLAMYGLSELIAEKLRALLQQVGRGRARRQDIYDIAFLVRDTPLSDTERAEILQSLRYKARSRGIEPQPNSLADPAVQQRAARQWETLRLELGEELPPFEREYAVVERFYRDLPWCRTGDE